MKRCLGAALLGLCVLLVGCSSSRSVDGPPSSIPAGPLPDDPVPRVEPRSKYGNPPSYVVFGRRYHVMANARGYRERGIASWYGTKFHGQRTSSGEIYDMFKMTAAHRSLPLPTFVEVVNLRNGAKAIVRINDRGPFHENRIIDLSYSAARKLGIIAEGTGLVEVRSIEPAAPRGAMIRTSARRSPVEREDVDDAAPRIFLQAGAFSEQHNARSLQTRLRSLVDVPVDVTRIVGGSAPLHRVRIGPLADVAAADRLSARIVDAGMELPRIVVD